MFTPTVAVLVMLLLVTREGYSKEGWKALGVHRLGLSMWPIAFGVTLLVSVTAQIIVLATPLASFRKPEHGIVGELISFLLQVILYSLTFVLAEEIGVAGVPASSPLVRGPQPITCTRRPDSSCLAHAPDFPHAAVPRRGEPVARPAAIRGHHSCVEFLRWLPAYSYWQPVAGRDSSLRAQRCLVHTCSVHRNLIAGRCERIPGRR